MSENPASRPAPSVLCAGVIVLHEGRALFVRQARGHSLEGQWSIPWGVVEPGEAPEAAALRETLEESSVTVRVTGLIGIQSLPQAGWVGIIFLAEPLTGEPTPDGFETDAAAYLTPQEIAALGQPVEPWCAWIVDRVLRGDYRIICPEPANPYAPRMAFL